MQAEHTENQIKREFEVLRQFLKDEEEARLGVLKAEVEHKTAMINQSIEEMQSELGILTNSIYAAEQDMRLSDVPFLQVGKTSSHDVDVTTTCLNTRVICMYIELCPYVYFSELQGHDQKVRNLQSYQSSEQI